MDGRARSFTHEAAYNVTYTFCSDEERERTHLSGSTVIQSEDSKPTQHRHRERDSTYVPADDEESDDDMYGGTPPTTYRKRPRIQFGGEDAGPMARKLARLGEKDTHQAGPSTANTTTNTTSSSTARAHIVPEPITIPDTEQEYIYISSDAEIKSEHSPSAVKKKKATKRPRHHTLPSMSVFDSVAPPSRKAFKGKASVKESGPVPHSVPIRAIPSWFENALRDIRRSFPTNADMTVFHCNDSDGQDQWGVECRLCNPPKKILVGPGRSLYNFRKHLTGVTRHNLRSEDVDERSSTSCHKAPHPGPAVAPSSSGKEGASMHPSKTLPLRKQKQRVEDVVERFLKEMGLTGELADALHHVGISDEARMKALGQLPDSVLDRLEKSLVEEGLDLSACLLVREGLKRRARATAP